MWDEDMRRTHWQGMLSRASLFAAIPAVHEGAKVACAGDHRTLMDLCVALAFGAARSQSDLDHLIDAVNEITLLVGDQIGAKKRPKEEE